MNMTAEYRLANKQTKSLPILTFYIKLTSIAIMATLGAARQVSPLIRVWILVNRIMFSINYSSL